MPGLPSCQRTRILRLSMFGRIAGSTTFVRSSTQPSSTNRIGLGGCLSNVPTTVETALVEEATNRAPHPVNTRRGWCCLRPFVRRALALIRVERLHKIT